MVLGVQNIVGKTRLLQHTADQFRMLNRNRSNEYRLASLVCLSDFFHHRCILLSHSLVNHIVAVDSANRTICWHHNYIQLVNLSELSSFRLRRASHTRKLFIHSEIVLNSNSGQRLGLTLYFDALLSFNSLVKTITPASARHKPACILINDYYLIILNNVFNVLLVQTVGSNKLIYILNSLSAVSK